MATLTRNLEWLNHNSVRSYPLAVDATAEDLTGTFKIPADLLLSLYLAIPANTQYDPTKFHILTIGSFATGYSVVIGYDGTPAASALVARSSHARYTPYRLGGLGSFVDATGLLVVGSLDNADTQPGGQFTFDITGGKLEVDCIRPNIQNVTALQVVNNGETSQRIYGDVRLVAGTNIKITPTFAASPVEIRIDAIEGEGLNEDCVCGGDVASSIPIKSINGIPPTASGDFTVLGSDCLEVSEVPNGIRLTDTCSSPCCGCSELETVTSALETLRQQTETLGGFITSLEGRVSTMDSAVFASSMGSGSCET